LAKRQSTSDKQDDSRKIKDRMLNVKLPDEDYEELQEIAREVGITLSGMVRIVLNAKLDKVRKSKNARDFID
jgi:antitoxin component of RelBE/YafQ-DinJ toxin-antitoxin module